VKKLKRINRLEFTKKIAKVVKDELDERGLIIKDGDMQRSGLQPEANEALGLTTMRVAEALADAIELAIE